MCVFVSRPMNFVTFLRKNRDPAKRVVDFHQERDTFRNTIMEIVEDVDEKSYHDNGKPWKSSKILRVNPNFFISLSVFIIFSILSFFTFFIFLFLFLSWFFHGSFTFFHGSFILLSSSFMVLSSSFTVLS